MCHILHSQDKCAGVIIGQLFSAIPSQADNTAFLPLFMHIYPWHVSTSL